MLFNSFEFGVFLPIVFIIYWFVLCKNLRTQNIFLLFASYFFYGSWNWRFLILLVLFSAFNYLIGIRIDRSDVGQKKKAWLLTGLIINISVLALFKYYDFFIDSFIHLFSDFGYNLPKASTKIILPLGISFYVFLSTSYIIDIYNKKLVAYRNIVDVLLALSFFPIILAGPIQRPLTLLPQITNKRVFNYEKIVDGLRQILWGLFVKVVIADRLAIFVDDIFQNYTSYTGSTLLIGAVFYTVQIYADFSGYSNMAIGIAKLLGFSLMQNFAYPYFARDISEFWKRWHISLTTWFRDYVFLPVSLALSWRIKGEKVFFFKTDILIYIVSSTITWFLTGLWHGTSFTYIVWGMIHGFFLIIYHLQKKPRKRLFKKMGIDNDNILIIATETVLTLIIVVFAWIFFRAENINHATNYINGIFSLSLFSLPQILPKRFILLMVLYLFTEWFQRNKEHALHLEKIYFRPVRWGIYYGILYLILLFIGGKQDFIYFQF